MNTKYWSFADNECRLHILSEDEGISLELDEEVLYATNAIVIDRMIQIDDGEVTIINQLPERYHNYFNLFLPSPPEKLAPCSTVDHTINLKLDTQQPRGPIYPLSQKQLQAVRKYLDNKPKQGKISPDTSPNYTPILYVPKPDGLLRLHVDYRGPFGILVRGTRSLRTSEKRTTKVLYRRWRYV